MSNKPKGKLDAITFIYGFGAAVVLVGAMFKFLGWQFANELFVVGLSIEAVVFLISAFERKTDDKEYNWENVFPQLSQEGSENPDTQSYGDALGQFSQTLGTMTNELKAVSDSLNQIKVELQSSAQNASEMKEKMSDFNSLMDNYNSNLRTVNDKYNQMLSSK
jgi:gliding motility-associated protein GldL